MVHLFCPETCVGDSILFWWYPHDFRGQGSRESMTDKTLQSRMLEIHGKLNSKLSITRTSLAVYGRRLCPSTAWGQKFDPWLGN